MAASLPSGWVHGVAFALGLMASGATCAESRLLLYTADSPRPGILDGCEMYFFAKTAGKPWRKLEQSARLEWAGGAMDLNSESGNAQPLTDLREQCFRLELDGDILVGGAVISSNSARRLNFPVLAISSRRDKLPLRLELHSQWPASTPESEADWARRKLEKVPH